MDPMRQIRLLIPPFFFYASIILAKIFSTGRIEWISDQKMGEIAGIAAFLALSALPLGFLISSLTILTLRVLFPLFGKCMETDMDEKDLDRVWPILGTKLKRDYRSKTSWTGEVTTPNDVKRDVNNTLDHGILYNYSKGLHEFIMRSYTAFIISSSSAIAILLSYIAIYFLNICLTLEWCFVIGIILLILIVGAYFSRRDTLRMVKFQTYRIRFGDFKQN